MQKVTFHVKEKRITQAALTYNSVGSIPSSVETGLERDLNLAIDLAVKVPNRISLSISTNSMQGIACQ